MGLKISINIINRQQIVNKPILFFTIANFTLNLQLIKLN
ncbi:hypothetical protein RG47T_3826 [Mucilaginibacter polytrichastri]|uniref:Uncharacterized protein n=1 Tax=Mucilaginibacter polytrichastri TaxID=1302689 RepID=A0A1Q6A2X0_9SPHI|nr:hypothetical protein RG47T_3826 [Mucilaginibacter polytrichastri]